MKLSCPSCERPFSAEEAYRGQVVECPHCRAAVTVPALVASDPDAIPEIQEIALGATGSAGPRAGAKTRTTTRTRGVAGSGPVSGLGLAGLVVSVVGLVATCGLLSPMGLLLSAFALRSRPRGLAVAGAVVGLAGTVWFFVGGMNMLWGIVGGAARGSPQSAIARDIIRQHYDDTGELPDNFTGQALLNAQASRLGNDLRYDRVDDGHFRIVRVGTDGLMDTGDDQVLESGTGW
jgi:hypothetical protein